MNKRFSKFMLTSASALALLAAYPSVASTANEALGVNLPSVSVSAAANEDAFVLQVKRLAYNDAIAEMEVLDLTSTSAAVQAARASYNALSASGKANSTVSNWEANLRSKEAAVGAAFVRQVKLLPYVSDIDASDSADVRAVRALYVALPASAKANAAVITWEGHLTSKQAALPETSEIDAFLDAAKALPYLSEIAEMDADELEALSAEMEEVRSLYDALSDEAKADANVNRWVGYLGDKEEAVLEASTPVEEELVVESVSAINLTTVNVEFSEAIDALERSAVTVTNGKTSAKQTIKSVTLSEDKTSAEIVLYNPLVASTTYGVDIVVEEDTLSAELAIGDLVATTIEADTTQTVRAGEPTTVKYKVFDADGIEITNSLGSDYAVAYTSTAVKDGKVTLATGTQTSTKVQVKKGTEVVAESETITLVATDTELSSISNWTIGSDTRYDHKDYKQVTSLDEEDTATVKIEVIDQFDKEVKATDYTVQYTSLDTSVGIVDKSTGKITPVSKGELPIQIEVLQGDKVALTETVIVNVTEVAKFEALTLDNASVTLSKLDAVGTKVTATVVDQFGNAWTDDLTQVTIDTTNTNVDVTGADVPNAKGQVEFTINAATGATAGTYTLDVKYGAEKVGTLTVVLEEAGVFAGYDVRGLETELDLNLAETNKKKEMTITAVPVDADGKAVGDAASLSLEVTEKGKSDPITAAVSSNTVVTTGLEKGKEYEVAVTVNSVIVKKHEFKVVDSTPATVIEFTSTTLADVVKDSESLLEAINNQLIVNGNTVAEGASKAATVEFTTGDSSVINNDGTVFADSAATTIYVKVITLADGKEVALSNVPLTIKTEFDVTKHSQAPENGATSVESSVVNNLLAGVNRQNAKFLVAGIYPGEAGQEPTDALTLDQVKAEIDAKYGVNFNKDAIKIEDGKVSIVGSVLSTTDWYKVKANGNIAVPYKISLLKNGADDITNENRALRIAMYADGKAVIEDGAGQAITPAD